CPHRLVVFLFSGKRVQDLRRLVTEPTLRPTLERLAVGRVVLAKENGRCIRIKQRLIEHSFDRTFTGVPDSAPAHDSGQAGDQPRPADLASLVSEQPRPERLSRWQHALRGAARVRNLA